MADERSEFPELGSTGLQRTNGFIHEEFLPVLQGHRGIKVYKEMRDNDAIVGAMLFAIENLIKNTDWQVVPGGDSDDDKLAALFLEEALFKDMSMPFDEFLGEALSMLTFGWSLHEIIFKRRLGVDPGEDRFGHELPKSKFDDQRVGIRKLPIRSQDSLWEWVFDDEGGVQAMVQQAAPVYQREVIPIAKSLLFRPKVHKGNPEGRSILRNAYRSWFFKKHIENIEGIGIERDLAGLPFARVPSEVLSTNTKDPGKIALRNEIENIVKNVRRDEQEGIMWPSDRDQNGNLLFDFELLSTGGRRQFDTEKIIGRYDQRILMTSLADFIMLGHEKVGSFSLASSKTGMFASATAGHMGAIAEVVNRFLVPKLFAFNTLNFDNLPMLTHGDIETVDLTELGDYITKLTQSGVRLFPDDDTERYLKQQANLPVPEEEGLTNEDLAKGKKLTTSEQTNAVARINKAVRNGKMGRPEAIELVQKALGVDKEDADLVVVDEG